MMVTRLLGVLGMFVHGLIHGPWSARHVEDSNEAEASSHATAG